jgi:hypothetical protein
MNLFLLSVSRVSREFFDAVDSISQLPLIFQWRFQGLQWLCLRWRFLVSDEAVFTSDSMGQDDPVLSFDFIRQPWISMRCRFHPSTVTQFSKRISRSTVTHSVVDDSMRQTWIYFCYQFYALLVNSLKLSTPHVSCHSYFSGDFKVNSHSLLTDNLLYVVPQF